MQRPDEKRLPEVAELRRLLSYDPETGLLFWKLRTPDMFTPGERSAEWNCARWNSKCAGKPALNSLHSGGYRHGPIWRTYYLAHRVIWKWVHGAEPGEIDHINGDRADNRLSNLRVVSRRANSMNVRTHRDTLSGVMGVRQVDSGKWAATGTIKGKPVYIGTFPTIEEAAQARLIWQAANGFHPNHGRKEALNG